MWKRFATLGRAGVVALALCGHASAAPWPAPDPNGLADDPWGRAVRYGRDLTVATARLIGPEAADPARRFAGNNLSCQNCHLNGGTSRYALPYVGVFAVFPQYRAREGQVRSLEDRINGCMTRSMNGRELPVDGPEMQAMMAYMKFLSTGIAVGAATPGRGSGDIPLLDRAADPARGAAVFAKTCAACHGADGAGKRVGTVGDARGYAFPPLWGPDSFNDGAGMARLITSAGFIRSNMPAGTTWEKPALSVEDAWDVAAYVESQPRPHMAGLEQDFPKRLQKPVDAAYPPWPDPFGPDQHRYGPYAPIKEAISRLRAIAGGQPASPDPPADITRQ